MFPVKHAQISLALLWLCIGLPTSAAPTAKEPWQIAAETEVWSPIPAIVSTNNDEIPSDAIPLFNGKDLNQWQSINGDPPTWAIQNGNLIISQNAGSIKTKEAFCDIQLHIEWMTPTVTTDNDGHELEGQGRGNSGIFFQERYEIQILDSFKNKTYANGQAGSIYKQSIPLVNASRPPGMWQTYDIIFTAPQFSPKQSLIKPGFITLLHNGVLIQNHQQIAGTTEWAGKPKYQAHGCAPLILQDHGSPVSFRNIWVRTL